MLQTSDVPGLSLAAPKRSSTELRARTCGRESNPASSLVTVTQERSARSAAFRAPAFEVRNGAPATIRTSYLRQVRAALYRVSYGCMALAQYGTVQNDRRAAAPHRHRRAPSSRRLAGATTRSESFGGGVDSNPHTTQSRSPVFRTGALPLRLPLQEISRNDLVRIPGLKPGPERLKIAGSVARARLAR